MIKSCAAIVIAAKHGELVKVKDASGIAYTVGTLRCKFEFRTTDWDYTARTAVFCKGNVSTHPKVVDTAIGVALDGIDECAVPPEVLLPDEKYFSVGVWGVTKEGLRIVSEWIVYSIKDGCYVDSAESFLPTPSVYEQIMIALNSKAPIEHTHEEYLTSEDLTGEFAEEVASKIDLDAYVLEEELSSKVNDLLLDGEFIKDALEEYVTEEELNDKGYLTEHQSLEGYAKTVDIPKKISELENDKGYLVSYTETDPTVPDWAKNETKPTYTAEEVGALPNTTKIPSALSDLQEDETHRTVTDAEKKSWNAKSDFSGSYDDLSNKPAIPSIDGLASEVYVDDKLKDKVDKIEGKGLSTNDYTSEEKNKLAGISEGAEANVQVDWNQTDETKDDYIKNKPIVDQIYSDSSENAQSGIAIAEALNAKQDQLISGTNIKTINGEPILGEGDITIEGGSDIAVDSELSPTSENPVQNKVITSKVNALENKLADLLNITVYEEGDVL